MALIHCPECDKEISDKVEACPFCGFPFSSTAEKKNDVQPVEIASVNISPKDPVKTKKIIMGAIAIIVFVALSFAIYSLIKNNNEKTEYNAYIDTLNLARMAMIDGGSEAESLLNLTARVWYNTIYEESDPETDKYTKRGNNLFNDDFNTSLMTLMYDSATLATISKIEDNQSVVEPLMKNLQDPPKDLENCYDTVTELYLVYKSLTDLAISPKGSLQSFSENKSQKIDDFLKLYQKLETQIPEKK